jgi:peptidoglycan/LPS O-acetylase OafA/YrhL
MIATTQEAKPHYLILDALRGVAALMVVAFHLFEAHATDRLDQIINHGYLAVDFFFVLSGFVIGYAYDDRWHKLTLTGFFKRRLVRLQPMVIMGMIIGAVCFYFQDSSAFPLVRFTPVWKMLLIMVIGFTMLPVPPAMDIRGRHEMYPLNGPTWSLFFEYFANIAYALVIRKFSKTMLWILVIITGAALLHLGLTTRAGDIVGGWALERGQLRIGFTRVMYPFFAGLLLARTARITHIKNAFLWCSLLTIIVLAMPRLGGAGMEHRWMNGLYESLSVLLLFPLIVYAGASGTVKGKFESRVCKFLGEISYPIYITHYPLIYIYSGWIHDNKIPFWNALLIGLLVFLSSIALAYACLKLYDEPIREWLKRKVLTKG